MNEFQFRSIKAEMRRLQNELEQLPAGAGRVDAILKRKMELRRMLPSPTTEQVRSLALRVKAYANERRRLGFP